MRRSTARAISLLKMMYYPEQFGYHGIGHPENVYQRAMQLADRVEKAGQKVDRDVLTLGCWGHDAGCYMPWADLLTDGAGPHYQFRSAEDFARYLTARASRLCGVPASCIEKVGVCIIGTHPDEPLPTVEAQILAAADLSEAAGDYTTFSRNTHSLYGESSRMKGQRVPFSQFAYGTICLLGRYLARYIKLTSQFYDEVGRSQWHVGTAANLFTLGHQVWDGSFQVIVDYGWGHFSPALCGQIPYFGNTVCLVVVRPNQADCRTVMSAIADHYHQIGAVPPMLVGLPQLGVLSLPDRSVDQMFFNGNDAAAILMVGGLEAEVLRLYLKNSASIHFYSSPQDTIFGQANSALPALRSWMAQSDFYFVQFSSDDGFPEAVFR